MVEQKTENLCVSGSNPLLSKMVQVETKIKIVDNSGGKWAQCILVKKKGKHPLGCVGTFLLVTLKKFSKRKKVNKRIIYIGLVVGVCAWATRTDGTFIKLFSNRILLFNKQFKFLGTRVYGSIMKEIKITNLTEKKNRKYFLKIFSYSSSII